MKKATVRSHYLPRTYLKHFFLNNELLVYNKGEKFFTSDIGADKRIFSVVGEEALVNVGVNNNLYTIDAPGITSDDVEDIFKEYGEDFLDEMIMRIEMKHEGGLIEKEIKEKLCIFLAAMRVRTPFFKFEVEESSSLFAKHSIGFKIANMDISEIRSILGSKGDNLTNEQIESARQALVNNEYNLKWPNAHFLKQALSSLNMYVEIFRNMNIVVLRSRSDRYFVTSDNPVVYFVPREKTNIYNNPKSLMSNFTEVFFPLTRNHALHLCRQNRAETVLLANRQITDIVNYNIMHNSFNFIISPIKMNALVKFIQEYIPYPFRLTTH